MKKVVILILFSIILLSCKNTNIFNGDIQDYKNEVTKEEWELKRLDYFYSFDKNSDKTRDLSSIIETKIYTYTDEKLTDESIEVINVSYDADNRVVATVYDNDFSTRDCWAMDGSKVYKMRVVNLQIIEIELLTDANELTLSHIAKEYFWEHLDEIYYTYNADECSYYIDNNAITVVCNDSELNGVFQYIFTEKYACFNYKIELIKDNVRKVKHFASYLLYEEVEIASIF